MIKCKDGARGRCGNEIVRGGEGFGLLRLAYTSSVSLATRERFRVCFAAGKFSWIIYLSSRGSLG